MRTRVDHSHRTQPLEEFEEWLDVVIFGTHNVVMTMNWKKPSVLRNVLVYSLVVVVVAVVILLFVLSIWVDSLMDQRGFRGIWWSAHMGPRVPKGNNAAFISLLVLTPNIIFVMGGVKAIRRRALPKPRIGWNWKSILAILLIGSIDLAITVTGMMDLLNAFVFSS